ncbi:glycosyl transferase [Hoyosella sp. G463]|uniref:Glycosyl transferase n=1 Tax=Lolliginicoccus lacisalsi TaxID=2742202 RepID=A0A927JA19_9ACTN|nr:nucleotide disphospho-sugar-binding domain-containing protein [Lolliginicoccus lacisalsi]MBD8505419.1 glycosyl transferase [Lolliginicoccus lacisalsi]
MRIAVVAGPDPGHAFPAMALARHIAGSGSEAVVFTGTRWLDHARAAGLDARELPGLGRGAEDLDVDAGHRIHERAATMSTQLLPALNRLMPDLVVSDVITVAGGLAAERLGIPWAELSPHPLYLPSRGLPPVGSGLEPGTGLPGRARDTVLRALVARDRRRGQAQRARARASIGMPERDPGPRARLIATLPAMEVPRPDWPAHAHLVGPLVWEPASTDLPRPPGDGPLVMVSPSTASRGGVEGMIDAVIEALRGGGPPATPWRMVATVLGGQPRELPDWCVVGQGRQEPLLREAAVLVCGGGPGTLARALLAGTPMVIIPGEGDQRELAARAQRRGVAEIVRTNSDGDLDPAAVRAAIERVVGDPRYRAAAAEAARTASDVQDPLSVCEGVLARG